MDLTCELCQICTEIRNLRGWPVAFYQSAWSLKELRQIGWKRDNLDFLGRIVVTTWRKHNQCAFNRRFKSSPVRISASFSFFTIGFTF